MGSFSWLRADRCTERANLTIGDNYKILIPIEFGGGYIKDTYWDYGYINHYGNAVYTNANGVKTKLTKEGDLYGMLALMNMKITRVSAKISSNIIDILENGDTCNSIIRGNGIDIGCYDDDQRKLQFPFKLVSRSYNGTYEDLNHFSCGDPEQGFTAKKWDSKTWYGHSYTSLYEKSEIVVDK